MRKIGIVLASLALPAIVRAQDIGPRIQRQDVIACQTPGQEDQLRWSANADHGDQKPVPGCFEVPGDQIASLYVDGDAPMVRTLDGRRLHLDNTPTPDEANAMAAELNKQKAGRAIALTIHPEQGAMTPAARVLFGR